MDQDTKPSNEELLRQRIQHAAALARGDLPPSLDLTLSEALVLGLLRQGVHTYFAVLGHGSTEVGEVLRIYQEAGLVKVYGVRSEIEASHAATALRWVTGEKAAVVTSIGPGALQALAASLAPASDGIGVWYLFGDETSRGRRLQHAAGAEARAGAVPATGGQRWGAPTACILPLPCRLPCSAARLTVDHPYRPGPFYLLLPMNTQAAWLQAFNLDELPETHHIPLAGGGGRLRPGAGMDPATRSASWSRWAAADARQAHELTTLLERSRRCPGAHTHRHRVHPLQPPAKHGRGRLEGFAAAAITPWRTPTC